MAGYMLVYRLLDSKCGKLDMRMANYLSSPTCIYGPFGYIDQVDIRLRCICELMPTVHVESILVDPASCHMLVSKIKPCMSKYTLWHSETANGSLNQLWFIRSCVLRG